MKKTKANHQQFESALEGVPSLLKTAYIQSVSVIKKILKGLGLLAQLDTLAKQKQSYHYLRSLLAIHQLDDMIMLDVPWWTYDAISEIENYIQRKKTKLSVFEYGSGASTIWLAKRADKVISVEHDQSWYVHLNSKLSAFPQVQLSLIPPQLNGTDNKYKSQKCPNVSFKTYVESIHSAKEQYDIIIIDGRARSACLETCLAFLKPEGIIIFDNSNRKRYQPELVACGLEIVRFYGRVPGSPFKSETAILSRKSIQQK
ncbi:MAG: class I SAM-dependent methyltransferase [Proteobacteria bacterium]|nr:class I SAM-dependent methyltransferase [Pseudomonadota bacterium]